MDSSTIDATRIATLEPTEFKFSAKQFVTNIDDLLAMLQLPPTLQSNLQAVEHFALRVPRAFVEKMHRGDPHDPLLLQVLPLHLPKQAQPKFSTDPLGEAAANVQTGIIHKYRSRLLLTLTGSCAIHCRYCFRQHFDYQANLPKADDWQRIASYIQSNPDINEVILSGGDPLMLTNQKLSGCIKVLEALTQVQTLRIHSRVPVVMPNRLDDELLHLLKNTRLNTVMVIHANHPNEIDHTNRAVFLNYKNSGITFLNQSVLLKGINNNAQVLAALSDKLFAAGVLPYYLHLLDKVSGTEHFDTSKKEAITIHQALQKKLAGYLVPKLVCEEPNKPHKTLIF